MSTTPPEASDGTASSTPTAPGGTAPDRKAVLAASAPWLGAVLNLVPGLGTGYIYQRRWKAYWITSALATAWFVLGAVLGQDADLESERKNQLIGLAGLLLLAAITTLEAFLAGRKARMD
jgi:hypothetical protein